MLEPGGALSRAMPDYEDRAEQRAMSEAVARALAGSRPLIVEAGTGTGKTLAYLVPALQSGLRVVVSTGTRALQDQIARHDIPLLRALVAKPFEAVVLKGVSNYVCRRRLAELSSKGPDVSVDAAGSAGAVSAAEGRRGLTDAAGFAGAVSAAEGRRGLIDAAGSAGAIGAAEGRRDLIDALVDWSQYTVTGDRAEVEWLGESAPLWTEVTTTPDARIGPRCPYFERCFITQARRLADHAQLILVNHHLYLADRALRASHPGAKVLPEHDAVIFDEAHQLEDVATEHFGARISTHRVGELVRDAQLALAAMPLWGGRAADDAIRSVERSGIALFAAVRGQLVGEDRVPLPPGLFEQPDRQRRWFELDNALEHLARIAEDDSGEEPDGPDDKESGKAAALSGIARRSRSMRDDLAAIAEQRDRTHVYWGEARPTHTSLTAAPIEVAELMRRHVISSGPTAIFTSATLATAGELGYARARLGLDDADELIVASPFDYARQAMLYVPRDLPPVQAEDFAVAAAVRTRELLAITEGRAFLLFTSHRALKAAARLLEGLPYPRMIQGEAPRASMIDRFRATPNAVLLGTASFWEGVDVPGDALSLVVIDKLPFSPHTDPLVAARMRTAEEKGGDPFAQIQLPEAALALKQGFGRLIRRRDDRGIVAILDNRVVTRGYGRVFLETLPTGLPRTSAIEQVRRWWRHQDSASSVTA